MTLNSSQKLREAYADWDSYKTFNKFEADTNLVVPIGSFSHVLDKGMSDIALAEQLHIKYLHEYGVDRVTKQWRQYRDGIWTSIDRNKIHLQVGRYLEAVPTVQANSSRVSSILSFLEPMLTYDFDRADRKLLPMQNGVLDLETRQLIPHEPDFYFTWRLPYDYDEKATCPQIEAWFDEVTQGHAEVKRQLIAFARATVLGCSYLEVFLEIYGSGGTGKSTFMRLLKALVGSQNTVNSSLKRLSGQFETARFYGKRLITFTDEAGYTKNADILKKLTGNDELIYEEKNQQAKHGFVYHGMVILSGNQILNTPDKTSGLSRRRITIPFSYHPSERKRLIEFDHGGKPYGLFHEELSGFLNLVLAMSTDEMESLLKEFGRGSSISRQQHLEVLCENNPIAQWAEERLVYDPGVTSPIGTKKHLLVDSAEYLYPNYCTWCSDNGINDQKWTSQQHFSNRLVELATNQLGYSGIEKCRKNTGWGITCIRLRAESDTDKPSFVKKLIQLESEHWAYTSVDLV